MDERRLATRIGARERSGVRAARWSPPPPPPRNAGGLASGIGVRLPTASANCGPRACEARGVPARARLARAGRQAASLAGILFAAGAHAQTAAIVANPASVAVNEGGSATYTVALATQPSAAVTVTVASDNTDVTADTSTTTGIQTTLSFSTTNWNTAQTVTVAAAGDSGSADETATLTHTATGGDYASVTRTVFVAVQDDEQTGTDYDTDEDGLIEISSLAQLNAIRWDLNGDGAVSSGDTTNYTNAFSGAATGMGCPDGSDANDEPDACRGYELTQNLDFDTDDDGDVDSTDPGSYDNWDPIGDWATTLDGGGHVIENLTMSRTGTRAGLFSRVTSAGVVRGIGLLAPNVSGTGGSGSSNGVAALVGRNEGVVAACYVLGGSVTSTAWAAAVAGLVGSNGGTVRASYANVTVSNSGQDVAVVGGLAAYNGRGTIAASYAASRLEVGGSGVQVGGLAGNNGSPVTLGTFTNSYWDNTLVGAVGTRVPASAGRSTSQLQTPTSATGIYAAWAAEPWVFGANNQYPVLSYGNFDTAAQLAAQQLAVEVLVDANPQTTAIDAGPLVLHESSARSRNYSVRLSAAPPATATVTLASDNGQVTLSSRSLTFTTTNWNTAQTVTAATTTDADAVDEAADVTHAATSATTAASARRPTTTLRVGVGDAQRSGTDYDADEDGLIDIDSLDKFNAMRWDLNGDGAVSSGDTANYTGAFPAAAAGMGCPDRGDADNDPEPCEGYELTSDLDFDTNGSGATWTGDPASPDVDPNDAYYNNGGGFEPIGYRYGTRFNTTFHGAGHVISNLFNSSSAHDVGVFGATGTSARIVAVGFRNLRVRGWSQVGGLVGHNQGRIAGVWLTGNVHGGNAVGGLVGATQTASSVIVASYSRATVHANSQSAGLAGWNDSASSIRASYSTGAAGGTDGFSRGTGTVVASYWDTDLSTISDDSNTASPEGRTSAQLQAPMEYGASGLYAAWDDQDVDGDGESGESVDDDAWDFGTNLQHPVLKFGGFDTAVQFGLQSPNFGASTMSNITDARTGVSRTIQVPAASHAGAVTYTVVGLPPGMSFDADGTGTCSALRTICGAPTRTGVFTVIVTAANAYGSASSTLSFQLTVGGVEVDAVATTTAVVEAGPIALDEDTNGTTSQNYRVKLTSAPTGTVTVTFASADTGAVAVDASTSTGGVQTTLSFTTANWNTWQTASASIVQDTDFLDETVAITHAASGGGYNGQTATLTVTVADDEPAPEVLVDANPNTAAIDPGPLVLRENSAPSRNYSVKLSSQPPTSATVTLSSDNAAVTLSHSALTFTNANWNTAQTVTATTTPDADAVDEAADVVHALARTDSATTLRVGVRDAQRTGTDYDTDEDGLIEINSLAKLNAMRWDLDGNGGATAASYATAFPAASTGMGCPDRGLGNDAPEPCVGYELTSDLDFAGSAWEFGWDPIGPASTPSDATHFNAVFDGNGHSIRNLFVNAHRNYSGLFAALRGSAVVRSLGLPNARVTEGLGSVAPLAGALWGRVAAVWASGRVVGNTNVGGLVGAAQAGSSIAASYSNAAVACGTGSVGGLAGWNQGTIEASYATGAVTGGCSISNKSGLAGGTGTVAASYWDTDLSDIPDDDDADPPEGRSTIQLQTPTQYGASGLYADWDDHDVDGNGTSDDAWHFGTTQQHPALKFGGFDPAAQFALQPPSFGSAAAPSTTLRTGVSGNLQVPQAAHPRAVSYTATGLPPGMAFGSACGARNICGRPTRAGTYAVTVWAANAAGARTRFGFTLDVGGIEIDTDAETPQVESGIVALAEDAASPARSKRYAVRLTSAPTGDVTVTITNTDTGAVTADADAATSGLQSALTFTTANWSAAQTVTLAVVVDADGADERATITHAASGGGYAGVSATLTATVADDETPAVVVDADPTTAGIEARRLTLNEATTESKNYGVYLAVRPSATVRVAVASSDTGAARVNRSQLTFTTTNWRTAQTVRVTAQSDGDALDESLFVTHAASGAGEYAGLAEQLTVVVQDDETHSGDYDDNDNDLIDVRSLAQLNAARWDLNGDGAVAPGDAANYAAAFPNAAAGMGCPNTCAGYELRNDLDFDTDGDGSTWEEVDGTVVADADDDWYNNGNGWQAIGGYNTTFKGNGHTIANLFSSDPGTGGGWVGLFGRLESNSRVESVGVVNAYMRTGKDNAGILGGETVGTIAACYVTGQVIGLGGAAQSVGGLIGQFRNGRIISSYSKASVNHSGRTGGLVGWFSGDNLVTRIDTSYSAGSVQGSGSEVGGLLGRNIFGESEVHSTYWDVTSSGRLTSGGALRAGLGLNTEDLQTPTSYTGFYSTWDDQDVDGDNTAGAAADADDDAWDFGTSEQYPALKFAGFDTASQFNALPTSFGGARVRDMTFQAGVVQSLQIPASYSGRAPAYSATGLPPGMAFDADGTGACGAAHTLCGAPTVAGTFAVVVNAINLGGGAALSFTVTVEGILIDAVPSTADVDPGPLALEELSSSTSNSRSYSVKLSAAPSASTTVTIVSADSGAVTVDTSTTTGLQDTLTFTTMNWDTAQTVTLAAVQDDDPVDETVLITHTASGGLDSTAYLTATVADAEPQRKLLFDVDPATAAIDPGPLLLEEGATPGREYAVKLPQAPSAAVTVTVASRSADVTADANAAAGVQTMLTFTTMNWDTWQTVTATAAEDDDAVDEATSIDHVASGAADYAGVTTSLRVGVDDDERIGTDYDRDEDGLIDIDSLAKLNAVRWDLDGDGVSTNATGYDAAFPGASVAMGCPDGDDPDGLPDACTGYELVRDLDFDTDGDGATHASGTSDSGDAYHNGGSGWDPIGVDAAQFSATFNGNGHVVRNLFISRSSRSVTALFSALRPNAEVRALGLPGAYVVGNWSTAALAGENYGRVAAVWASGTVQGLGNVGGLTGVLRQGGRILASYSTAAVACTGTSASHRAAGLAGLSQSTVAPSAITASYSTGAVTGACPTASKSGMSSGGTVAASYWDATLSGINDDTDANPPEGRTTTQLQSPTSATGIYAAWDDQDVDGDGRSGEAVDDDAWDFGTATQHPVLKFGGLDVELQFNSQGTDSAPSFGSATQANQTFEQSRPILPFQIPAATGGNGALSYTAAGLPDGLVLDSDGAGVCQFARGICGTPTTSGSAATVTITVTDNDDNTADSDTLTFDITITAAAVAGGAVLIDADPTTAALDPGPLFLSETATEPNNALGYSVRLAEQPTATVTVAVASGDTGAVTVDPGSLTFTTTDWATAQTVTATAVAESTDAVDESVTVTHTPTGGGYTAAATLRVAVADAERTGTDYDTDEDGLIEISTLAQLNAVRWDLNGDGAAAAGNQSNYNSAFGGASASMGCPTGGCSGYELTRDLDFDTDGDGSTWSGATPASDSGDTYHNSGNGWSPIGANATPSDSTHFNATFDGNGHSIHNLFANGERGWSGLFAALRGSAVVRSLGLPNAHVRRGFTYVGALAGENWGRVEAVWTTGAVAGNSVVGGLVGENNSGATIVASYSTSAVDCHEADPANTAGGLTAENAGTVTASYSTGTVSGSCPTVANKHGFAGGSGATTGSYWDTEASAVAASGQGIGRTTAQLQGPTSATGIYSGWDVLDVDGDGNAREAPWHFGTSSQYPVLSYRGADPVPQHGDYDLDDDGLIEVRTLAQLNAIRWDLDGDGAPSTGNAASWGKAFRNHMATMGCPTSTADSDNNDCAGFELENDLDFDTDGDGATWTDDGTFAADSGDAYYNGGSGWDPLGPNSTPSDTTHFNATFDGKGHVIANLLVNRNRNWSGLFAALRPGAVVYALGLPNAQVREAQGSAGPLAGVVAGRVAAAWASGAAAGETNVGGLVGVVETGATVVASYSTAAASCETGNRVAGGFAAVNSGTIAASYSTGAVTGACPTANKHGFASGAGTFTASYWDVNLSGIADDTDANSPEGETSENLRAPTGYSGLYADWDDQDVDGDTTAGEDPDDDAWDFGDQWQWPVLRFGGLDTALQIEAQPNMAPTFGAGTVPDKTYRKDYPIASFQVPAASGGEGVGYTYEASGLPAGLSLGAPNCAARTVCGTPTAHTTGGQTVTIHAHDGDTNRADSDRASLTFEITVVTPTAAITSTNPAALTEANLDNATVTVTLTDTAFASGAALSHFTLTTNVPGLTADGLATVSAGDTAATLTLDYTGTDFSAVRTIAVNVAAAAHDLPGAITSATVSVTPTPGIALSRPTLTLEEDPNAGGGTNANVGTYTIRLTADPTTASGGFCAVNITAASDNADVTLDADTLQTTVVTFSGVNWNTPQTITVTAAGDGDSQNDAATISHSRTGGSACTDGFFGTPTLPSLSVTVNDDDTAGIVLDANPTTANIDEAGPLTLRELSTASDKSRSYTVRLAVEPTQTVTVAISSNDAAVTVGTASLTFTSSNWDTRQTVTLTAADDNDGVGQSATITHTASTATPSEYTNISATLTANVIDDEAPGFVFDADPSSPATDEAGPLQLDEDQMSATNSASYAVRLSAQPTQDVTATITSGDANAVTVGDTDTGTPGDQNTLTFTTTNWDTVQTVTLTAQQDDGGANESVQISHAAATTPASEYTNVSADFEATVDDDETPAIALSASTLSVPEQRSATYTVALATPPEDGSATVAITGAADGIAASPTSLTFTSGNWNAPRTVTVSAANDQDSANEMVTLAHAASGGEYDGVTADLEVTATDDDTPSLLVSPTRLRVREAGSATYRLRLNTQPSAAVTVTVSGTTAEVTVDTDSDTVGDQTTLAFDATNWNANRTVTVSAAADDDATDETVNLLHAATGGDYTGLALASRPGVTVSVDDDDTPAILIDADPSSPNTDERGPLALAELSTAANKSANYTVRLATEPTSAVTVEISSGDRAISVDNDATPRTLTLTFSTTNWGTAQTVTATAAEDDDASNERVAIAHAATGGDYENVEAELIATTVDDDEPAILVDAAALTASGVAEGATATYTVRLETEPAGTATVSVAAGGGLVRADMDPQQAGVQSSLRFDATTWNTARTVQVRGLEDDDAAGGTATLRHTSSGADYGAAPAVETTFAVTDDDSPGVVVSPTSLAVNEGGAATYSVVLEAAPTGGDATVSPTSSDAAAATVSPATLTFTAGNWNRPQRVTVRGVADDEDATDGAATVSHAVAGADYAGVPASQVAVAVRDVQAAGVRIEPPRLALAEGGEASYRVRLNTQPAGDVTVTATSGSSELGLRDGNAIVGTLAVTFTTENWNTPQQVRASSIKDDDAADDATTVAHAVTGYAGVTSAPTLSVRVEDGDGAGIAFDPPGGVALVEGGSPATATYTAVLTAQPSGTVTVSVSSDDAGLAFDADDGTTGDQSSVAFDASNWNAPRTIEVRAVADGDAASETATLTHSMSGGGYDVAAGYEVRVSDADAAAAPRDVRVVAAGARSLTVRWTASANAEGYLVQWRRSGEAWSAARQLEVPAGATSARIDGLETGVRYEVRVIGLNRGDPGDPSAVETASPTTTASNRAPAATGALPAEVGLAPEETRALNLAAAFVDPDGDALTYTAWSSNRSVVTASVFGGELRLRAVDVGAAEVTVVAADPTELTARVRLRVVVGIALSLADASAPEGGTARLVAELSVSRAAATTFGWRVGADLDPATADADAGEHGDAAGEATIPAGETRTTIEIPIADDDVVEPAREWFEVALTAPADGCCVVQRMRARVAVREGVCDRSPAARDALRAAAACDAPTPAALAALTRLSLAGAGAGELRAGDFQNLAGLRTLDLSGNALAALPPGLFAGLAALRDLDLSGNALAALPPAPFAAVPRLRTLDLSANGFAALPPGLFAGLGNLREASLEENPGAPFALAVELARTDAEPGAAGPAAVEARFAAGAPFALRPPLAAEPADAAGLPATVSIAAGDTAGATFAAAEPPAGALRLQAAAPTLPPASCGAEWPFRACFRGFAPMPGAALLLFRQPPRALPAPQPEPLAGDDLRLRLASLVAAGDAPGALRFEATSSDESIAAVRVVGGELLVEPEPAAEGMVEIVVVATDSAGLAATVRFEVQVEFFAPTRQAAGWRSALRDLAP